MVKSFFVSSSGYCGCDHCKIKKTNCRRITPEVRQGFPCKKPRFFSTFQHILVFHPPVLLTLQSSHMTGKQKLQPTAVLACFESPKRATSRLLTQFSRLAIEYVQHQKRNGYLKEESRIVWKIFLEANTEKPAPYFWMFCS